MKHFAKQIFILVLLLVGNNMKTASSEERERQKKLQEAQFNQNLSDITRSPIKKIESPNSERKIKTQSIKNSPMKKSKEHLYLSDGEMGFKELIQPMDKTKINRQDDSQEYEENYDREYQDIHSRDSENQTFQYSDDREEENSLLNGSYLTDQNLDMLTGQEKRLQNTKPIRDTDSHVTYQGIQNPQFVNEGIVNSSESKILDSQQNSRSKSSLDKQFSPKKNVNSINVFQSKQNPFGTEEIQTSDPKLNSRESEKKSFDVSPFLLESNSKEKPKFENLLGIGEDSFLPSSGEQDFKSNVLKSNQISPSKSQSKVTSSPKKIEQVKNIHNPSASIRKEDLSDDEFPKSQKSLKNNIGNIVKAQINNMTISDEDYESGDESESFKGDLKNQQHLPSQIYHSQSQDEDEFSANQQIEGVDFVGLKNLPKKHTSLENSLRGSESMKIKPRNEIDHNSESDQLLIQGQNKFDQRFSQEDLTDNRKDIKHNFGEVSNSEEDSSYDKESTILLKNQSKNQKGENQSFKNSQSVTEQHNSIEDVLNKSPLVQDDLKKSVHSQEQLHSKDAEREMDLLSHSFVNPSTKISPKKKEPYDFLSHNESGHSLKGESPQKKKTFKQSTNPFDNESSKKNTNPFDNESPKKNTNTFDYLSPKKSESFHLLESEEVDDNTKNIRSPSKSSPKKKSISSTSSRKSVNSQDQNFQLDDQFSFAGKNLSPQKVHLEDLSENDSLEEQVSKKKGNVKKQSVEDQDLLQLNEMIEDSIRNGDSVTEKEKYHQIFSALGNLDFQQKGQKSSENIIPLNDSSSSKIDDKKQLGQKLDIDSSQLGILSKSSPKKNVRQPSIEDYLVEGRKSGVNKKTNSADSKEYEVFLEQEYTPIEERQEIDEISSKKEQKPNVVLGSLKRGQSENFTKKLNDQKSQTDSVSIDEDSKGYQKLGQDSLNESLEAEQIQSESFEKNDVKNKLKSNKNDQSELIGGKDFRKMDIVNPKLTSIENNLKQENSNESKQALLKGSNSIHKKSYKNLKKNQSNGTCSIPLLSAFGFKTTKTEERKPIFSIAQDISICRLNRSTCCNAKDFEGIQDKYLESAQKLRRSLDLVEDSLILFQGEKFQEFLSDLKGTEKCDNELKKHLTQGKSLEETFAQIKNEHIEEIPQLVDESALYYKNNIWYYGNILCGVCNPKDVENFHIGKKEITIKYNSNNCFDTLKMKEFELRLIRLYEKFLVPFQEVAKCHIAQNDKKDLTKYEIYKFQSTEVETFTTMVEYCIDTEDFTDPQCEKLCRSKQFSRFSFPVNIISAYKSAFKIIYEAFTDKEADSFLKKYYNLDMKDYANDEKLNFYNGKQLLDNIEYDIVNEGGLVLESNPISKKFTYREAQIIEINH